MLQSRKTWLWLVPVVFVTFWLGVQHLDTRPIWADEYYSIKDAGSEQQTPDKIWNEVAQRNPWHPPGFFIVLNAWGRLVSREPRILRLLAVLFGLLSIAWTYRLGADTVSRRVGLYGSVLLGTTVMMVFYLDQIRVYSLLTMLTTFTLWLYLRVTRMKSPKWHDWFFLTLGVAGLLYAHYFGAIILAAIGLYHLLFVAKNRRWLTITGVFLLAGLLFLPWVNVLLVALGLFLSPRDFHDRALSNIELIQVLSTLFSNGVLPLLGITLLLTLLARLKGAWRLWFFSAATLISILIVNAAFRAVPLSRVRYLLMLWPLFTLVMACGLVWLGRRGRWGHWAALTLLLMWAAAGILNADNPDLIDGLGGGKSYFPLQYVVRDLQPLAMPEDLMVGYWPTDSDTPNYEVVRYYFKQLPLQTVIVSDYPSAQPTVPPELLSDRNRVFVAHVPNRPLEKPEELQVLHSMLNQAHYSACGIVDQRQNLILELFARTPVCCGPGEAIARFDDGKITLAGIDGLTATDGQVKPTLGWSLEPDVPIHIYSVTLQVFDSGGNKVAQKDYGLPPRAYACETTPLDTANLPAGQYEIRAGVYAWQTQQRLTGVAASGEQGDLVPVGTFKLG